MKPLRLTLLAALAMALLPADDLGAQTTFQMANATVNDCDGVLTDSEAGQHPNTYDHNENLTFSICIPQAEKITISFISFCTEEQFDILRIYDGPDTLSPLVGGPYHGALGPFSVTATSGCMTINFISDPNVVCSGWVAVWDTEVEPPVPPSFLPLANVPCGSSEIVLQLSEPVACDSVKAGAFTLFGAQTYPVTQATPLNCVNGYTKSIRIKLGTPIDFSGNYTVRFKGVQLDECGDPYPFSIETGFSVTDCPLKVLLSYSPDPFCAGSCIQVSAVASGGDPKTYTYKWNPAAPALPVITACISAPTTYSVTVTDGKGSAPAVGSILITPLVKPTLPPDTTLCQSNPALWIPHTPAGGTWYGRGINPDRRWENRWDAWRLGAALIDTVIYVAPNGCADSMIINKIPLNQGGQHGVCPGASAFKVSGGTPAGGSWSGPFIAPDGTFTPPVAPGTYTVTYTHPNGCSGSKNINVADLVMPPDDTLCASKDPYYLPVKPFGGTWSGPGIVNAGNGYFDPRKANLGDNVLIYKAIGCTDTMTIHIRNIDASYDMLACPDVPAFVLPGNWTPGGVWSGKGVIDSLTGLYDPSILGHNKNDTIAMSIGGCIDKRIIYIRETAIYLQDTLRYCVEADSFELRWETVQSSPWNGTWSGPGTYFKPGNPSRWYFVPALAGPGLHRIVYDANGCQDSMFIEIWAPPAVRPDTVCVKGAPYNLVSVPPSASWQGTGIINAQTGLFDPVLAGVGTHVIQTVSTTGCPGGGTIVVTPPDSAVLEGIDPVYCFRDTQVQLVLLPPGGQFSIDGIPAGGVFNPAQWGPGLHTLRYRIGSGECANEKVRFVQVGEPVSVVLPFRSDTLCFAKGRQISALGQGGSSLGNYTYTWDQGLGFGQSHLVTPSGTRSYRVTVTDGCSDPAIDSLQLVIRPQIQLQFATGPKVCYGDTTSAIVSAQPPGNYAFTWQTEPPRLGDRIEGLSGTYRVEVLDQATGCRTSGQVTLPGFKPIQANFILNPQGECLYLPEADLEVLDLSNGGISGTWNFGDGRTGTYKEGQEVAHTFSDTGTFTVSLLIRNEGGCLSTHEETVCVRTRTGIWFPNALTANDDGRNDHFQPRGYGIRDIAWRVYDRWGTLIFEADDMNDRWDGTRNGDPLPQGAYVLVARYRTLYEEEFKDWSGTVMLLR